MADKFRAFKSQADMFEFVHPELSKVYGIRYYCSQHGYSTSEAAAFGDTTNDIEMLKECGTGVCMCNGTEDARQAADIVCQPVLLDGKEICSGYNAQNRI